MGKASDNKHIKGRNKGVSLYSSSTSKAFTLISFMVGELLYTHRSIPSPIDLSIYDGLSEDSFLKLQQKVLSGQDKAEYVHLSMKESILLYMIVDLACKCMVNEANIVLRDMAVSSLDIDSEEYEQLRMNYLRYAEALIEKMNESFGENTEFLNALKGLKGWNAV